MDYLEYCRRVQHKLGLAVANNAAIPHYMCTLARRVADETAREEWSSVIRHFRRFKVASLTAIGHRHSVEQFLFTHWTSYDNVPYCCERANKWRLEYMEKLIHGLETAE